MKYVPNSCEIPVAVQLQVNLPRGFDCIEEKPAVDRSTVVSSKPSECSQNQTLGNIT
jgi:hypothetical protein